MLKKEGFATVASLDVLDTELIPSMNVKSIVECILLAWKKTRWLKISSLQPAEEKPKKDTPRPNAHYFHLVLN